MPKKKKRGLLREKFYNVISYYGTQDIRKGAEREKTQ